MKTLVHGFVVLVLTGLVAAGCEVPLAPEAVPDAALEEVSALSKGGAAACPIPADVVVTDEAGLHVALLTASAGDVIGVDGMIELTADVLLTTEDLTLTCATSGSGFFAQPGAGVIDMLSAFAKGVTVDRLVLDARETDSDFNSGPYYACNDGAACTAEDVRFSNNTVTCGPGYCAFFAGVKGAVVVGNSFASAGSGVGVHIQGGGFLGPDGSSERPTDGTLVQRNTIITTIPQEGCVLCGGIRVRDGRDVEISHNIVRGPWLNAMSLTNLRESRIEKNRVEGAVSFGIATSYNSGPPDGFVLMRNNVFRNNRVTDVGSADATPFPPGLPTAGIMMRRACGNTFFGNNLQGNYNDLGALFTEMSGANTLAGNKNVVIDNGNFDCDDDGVADPNVITGQGQVLRHVNLGRIVSEAASGSGGKGPPLQ